MDIELRLLVSCIFSFPEVGVPALRRELLLRKWGAVPNLVDVYNLVPWTWLIDWFTGLGNYINLIDVINTNTSIINYGMITAVGRGTVRTHFRSYYDNSKTVAITGFPTVTTYDRVTNNHESVLSFKTQIRKDLTRSFGVPTTLEPGTLSPYQQSIIGAIVTQRSGVNRS